MKITLFTSNKNRHNYLINLLSEVSDELYVIQECGTIFPGIVPGHYQVSPIMKKYFENVNNAQSHLFGNSYVNNKKKNIKILPMISGDLNQCSVNLLSDFLKSDVYVVFGSSYIKGELVDFLVNQKAINIHAGVSPYYRGTDCNFWATYDDKPELVGATIYLLSNGLDDGKIIFHTFPKKSNNYFIFSMLAVKSAFECLIKNIKNKKLLKVKPIKHDKKNEILFQ